MFRRFGRNEADHFDADSEGKAKYLEVLADFPLGAAGDAAIAEIAESLQVADDVKGALQMLRNSTVHAERRTLWRMFGVSDQVGELSG